MRVAILGDMHGNIDYLDQTLKQAVSEGVESVIQVGDFGIGFDEKFLQNLEAVLNVHQVPLLVIRGNHDCPSYFYKYERHGWLNLIPDGMTARIGKKRVAFLGGAVSIDRNCRQENIDWWGDERVNPQIVNKWAYKNVRADVLISHEAPLKPRSLPRFNLPYDVKNDCDEDRNFIRMAAEVLEPDVIYHGHYHMRYQSNLHIENKRVLVEGIGCDGGRKSDSMIIREW